MRKISLLAAAVSAAVLAGCGGNSSTQETPATNVIFFLGDGMGINTLTAARIYKVGEDGDLTIDTLPETAFVRTYSNNAQVTDSAPSMAAYMTGVKMNNEVISMTPDTMAFDANGNNYLSGTDSTCPASGNGSAVTTLLELAKKAGWSTGAVTTTRVTHATPAVTYSHVCHRDAENNIAAQMVPGGSGYNAALGDGLNVLMGGGRQFYLPTTAGGKRTDGRDLTAMREPDLRAALPRGFAPDQKSSEARQLPDLEEQLFACLEKRFGSVGSSIEEADIDRADRLLHLRDQQQVMMCLSTYIRYH